MVVVVVGFQSQEITPPSAEPLVIETPGGRRYSMHAAMTALAYIGVSLQFSHCTGVA